MAVLLASCDCNGQIILWWWQRTGRKGRKGTGGVVGPIEVQYGLAMLRQWRTQKPAGGIAAMTTALISEQKEQLSVLRWRGIKLIGLALPDKARNTRAWFEQAITEYVGDLYQPGRRCSLKCCRDAKLLTYLIPAPPGKGRLPASIAQQQLKRQPANLDPIRQRLGIRVQHPIRQRHIPKTRIDAGQDKEMGLITFQIDPANLLLTGRQDDIARRIGANRHATRLQPEQPGQRQPAVLGA